MRLKASTVEELFFDEHDENLYEIIDEGDWVQECKFQLRTIIFKFEGLLYSVSASRSGSPFTDWYYEWEVGGDFEVYRVEPVTKTIVTYKVVHE